MTTEALIRTYRDGMLGLRADGQFTLLVQFDLLFLGRRKHIAPPQLSDYRRKLGEIVFRNAAPYSLELA